MTARKIFTNNFCEDIHRWKLSQRRALLLTVGVIIPGIQRLHRMPYHVLYARTLPVASVTRTPTTLAQVAIFRT